MAWHNGERSAFHFRRIDTDCRDLQCHDMSRGSFCKSVDTNGFPREPVGRVPIATLQFSVERQNAPTGHPGLMSSDHYDTSCL